MLASTGRAPGVTATLMRKGDAGMLRLSHVHPMGPGRVLEAWGRRDGELVRVGGLFEPDRQGRAMTMIPDVGSVDAVMVTAEPRGGSPTPTSAPMVTLAVSQ